MSSIDSFVTSMEHCELSLFLCLLSYSYAAPFIPCWFSHGQEKGRKMMSLFNFTPQSTPSHPQFGNGV